MREKLAATKILRIGTAVMCFYLIYSVTLFTSASHFEKQQFRFKKGEVMQLIAPVAKQNAVEARREYYRTAIPLAESYGFASLGQLALTQKVVGEFEPDAMVLGSWPSEKSFNDFVALPQWPILKQQRAEGWDELKLYNYTVTKDLELTFRQSKFYTVAFAWFNQANPGYYRKYLDGIDQAVRESGGRFMFKMRNISLEAHASPLTAPDQITFVEWDSEQGLDNLLAHEDYQEFVPFFKQGVDKFEFFRIAPVIKGFR